MKTLTIFFILLSSALFAQDNITIFNAINKERSDRGLPELMYRSGNQLVMDERVADLVFDFSLSEDCDCDYESIAGEYTINGLITKLTNTRRYEWYHFDRDIRFATVSVNKNRGIYYVVIRCYNE